MDSFEQIEGGDQVISSCCICYRNDGNENLFDTYITSKSNGLLCLSEMVSNLLDIQYPQDPVNQKNICSTCKAKIVEFHIFKESCRNSWKLLQKKDTPEFPSVQSDGIFDEDIFEELVKVVKSYMTRFSVASVEIEEDSRRLIITSTASLSNNDPHDVFLVDKSPSLLVDVFEPEKVESLSKNDCDPGNDDIDGESDNLSYNISIIHDDTSTIGDVSESTCILYSHQQDESSDLKLEPPKTISKTEKKKSGHQKIAVCDYCNKVFPKTNRQEADKLRGHKTRCKKKHFPDTFSCICTFCRSGYKTSDHLKKHMTKCDYNPDVDQQALVANETENRDTIYCGICNKKFAWNVRYLVKNHRDMHKAFQYLYEKGLFSYIECSSCNKMFKTCEDRDEHFCNELSDTHQRFPCSMCFQIYDSQLDLREHFTFKHIEFFFCPVEFCQVRKKGFNVYYYHMQKSHPGYIPTIKSFPCDYCSTKFKSYYELEIHRKRANCAGKYLICDHCGKRFGAKHELRAHLHKVINPVSCTMCNKVCEDSTKLKVHLRSHTQEKPFVCRVCGKGFTSNGNLAAHTKTHKLEKGFKCDYCPFATITNKKLKLHMQFHYEKVECPICNKIMSKKYAVETHIKTIHQVSDPEKLKECLQKIKRHSLFSATLKRRKL